MNGYEVQVGSTPVRVINADHVRDRRGYVQNTDGALAVRLSGDRNSAPSGLSLGAGDRIEVYVGRGSDIWAVCSGGIADVEVLI